MSSQPAQFFGHCCHHGIDLGADGDIDLSGNGLDAIRAAQVIGFRLGITEITLRYHHRGARVGKGSGNALANALSAASNQRASAFECSGDSALPHRPYDHAAGG
jgi:hypothetical protein